jgi:hypothetical protein
MGSSGPALGRNGWVRAGRAHGLGPNRKDRIGFLFSEIILNAKTIPENLEIILKACKILRKLQKFQKISQRH